MNYSEIDIDFMKQAWRLKMETKGSSKVAALVVTDDNVVLAKGVSKLPPGTPFIDGIEYLAIVIHAEENAIGDHDVRGCRIYVTQAPCEPCANLIKDREIAHVFYMKGDLRHQSSKFLQVLQSPTSPNKS